jgi:hypothetical protein
MADGTRYIAFALSVKEKSIFFTPIISILNPDFRIGWASAGRNRLRQRNHSRQSMNPLSSYTFRRRGSRRSA